jgi:predicted hotdog family 3-hydroxylacyl-ACP dehydratase
MSKTSEIHQGSILDLIPQRPPMVMVDHVTSYEPGRIETEFAIGPSNLFVYEGMFTESGMLENIAQTAAAMVGIDAQRRNVPVPLGFIGGISKVKVNGYAQLGDSVTTRVEVLQEVFHVTLVRARCMKSEQVLLECEMKIAIQQ